MSQRCTTDNDNGDEGDDDDGDEDDRDEPALEPRVPNPPLEYHVITPCRWHR